MGPYYCLTHDNKRGFLTLVDNYYRVTWVHLIKFKSDVFIVLKEYVAMIETRFNKKIKSFRTDNGQEIFNDQVNSLLCDKASLTRVVALVHNKIVRPKGSIHTFWKIAMTLKLQRSNPNIFLGIVSYQLVI